MARQNSYGEILRNARERKGMDIAAAARRLRIRADILQAIEDEDFSRMPPRGYTRNMVNAYARLVGVNPNEITDRYMDALYRHETGMSRSSRESDLRFSGRGDARDASRRASSFTQIGSDRRQRYSSRPSYDQQPASRQQSRSLQQRSSSGAPYSGFYSGPQKTGGFNIPSNIIFIAGAAIIVILLIVVLVMLLSPKDTSDQNVPAVPITGLTDPTANPDDSANANGNENADNANVADDAFSTAVAPTSVEFTYSVADGQEAYVEIQVGDSGTYDVSSILTGPASGSYTLDASNPTLSFVTTSPQNVTLRLDGDVVEAEELTRSPGVYSYTVDFNEILEDWEQEHPTAAQNTNGNSNQNASQS